MFNIGGNKFTATYGAIIDIGSGSVGVGILESDYKKRLPKILFAHRELIRPSANKVTKEDRIRAMRETLFSASLALSTEGLKTLSAHNKNARIKRILVTCASPWAHTISRKVFYKDDNAIKISSSLIKNLVQDAEDDIYNTLDETAIVGKLGLHIVERATVNTRINGYAVENPENLVGKEIEILQITGLVPEEIIDAIEDIQEKILVDTKLSVHTFMLVNYCIMRDLFPKTDSMCIIDVTGETTEIGIVEDGALTNVVHIPYGSSTLIREIISSTKGTQEEAESQLRSFVEQTSVDISATKISKLLENYIKILTETLTELHKNRKLPQTLVITALPQLEGLFRTIIPETAHKVTGDSYTILEIRKNILNEIASNENSDTFITLASRFFHKLHGCGEIDTL